MATDLVRHTAQLPAADEWKTMLQMADVFLQSGLLPSSIKSAAAAVTIIAKGRELGIPALYALSKISIINGKPACEAELMLAMIYRDHGDNAVIPVETDATHATFQYKRRGWPEYRTHTFTIEEARQAKLLGKATWQEYPPAMLRSRCISALARIGFADTLGGLYTPEELGARVVVDADGSVILDDRGFADEPTFTAGPIYLKHMANVTTAKSLNELKDAWKGAQAERALMSPDEWTEINRATNELKAEMDEAVATPALAPVAVA